MSRKIDVLCVGMATYDLLLEVDKHPGPDEKIFSGGYIGCGGGPASNAAVAVARLGGTAAFAGYLGSDHYGDLHFNELKAEGVDTSCLVRGGNGATRLAVVLTKPGGQRTVISCRGDTAPLEVSPVTPASRVVLFDGHEPVLSLFMAKEARSLGIPVVLDAGSFHQGTESLLPYTDYLIASNKFALSYLKRINNRSRDVKKACDLLSEICNTVIITLGEEGLLSKSSGETEWMPSFKVKSVDTTGAGDTFHGAFALGLAKYEDFSRNLRFASGAAALCCTKLGGRTGIPDRKAVEEFVGI